MKVLIIGNGYDKAHGLPTSYQDLLGFIELFRQDYNRCIVKADEIVSSSISPELRVLSENGISICDEFSELIEDSLWLRIFESKKSIDKWMDFEEEIENVLKNLAGEIGDASEC